MIIYDIIGYLSVILSVISFLEKDKTKMRIFGIFAGLAFGINIYGYGGYNGVFVSVISILGKVLAIKFGEDKLFFLKAISLPLALGFFFLFNSEGISGLLPALILVIVIFADTQKDIIKMKYIYIFSTTVWLIYSIVIWSVPGIVCDAVAIMALIYSILLMKGYSLSIPSYNLNKLFRV